MPGGQGRPRSLFYLKRERQERASGLGPEPALKTAAATSGRSMLVSGVGVLIAMAGMFLPEGVVLIAEMEGHPIAAVGIFDRHTVFDPHRSTFALRMRLRVLGLQIRLITTLYGA